MLNKVDKIQKLTIQSLENTERDVIKASEVGIESLNQLRKQKEQMETTINDFNNLDKGLDESKRVQRYFGRWACIFFWKGNDAKLKKKKNVNKNHNDNENKNDNDNKNDNKKIIIIPKNIIINENDIKGNSNLEEKDYLQPFYKNDLKINGKIGDIGKIIDTMDKTAHSLKKELGKQEELINEMDKISDTVGGKMKGINYFQKKLLMVN
jgi:hypothetical protein